MIFPPSTVSKPSHCVCQITWIWTEWGVAFSVGVRVCNFKGKIKWEYKNPFHGVEM